MGVYNPITRGYMKDTIRRSITVEPELLIRINEFRSKLLSENIELDFTKSINMFALVGIEAWHSKNSITVDTKKMELYFKYTGESMSESIMLELLQTSEEKPT